MTHAPLVWELSIALIVAMLLFDYFFHIRKAHVPTLAEAARWSAAYIAVASCSGARCSPSAAPNWASSTSPAT
jgi:tellurite resistance protein TerC